jgi:large subunit ribosomal protein L10
LVQKEYEKRFNGVTSFLVLQTIGINGIDNNVIRGGLKNKGIRMMVVKNSLMRKAMESLGCSDASRLFEAGPCTIAFGGDSIVDVAREIEVWANKKKGLVVIRGAYVEGQALNDKAAQSLSKMPTRPELQGQIAGAVLAPGANVVGAIAGPGKKIAGCLKSLIEKKEKEAA